jgi:Sulfotransferase domain
MTTTESSVLPLMKRSRKEGKALYKLLTNGIRLLPNFIIIGVQRGGTTSLHSYIARHPGVEALKKEVHFFDLNFSKGIGWYKAKFPYTFKHYFNRTHNQPLITGEASPYYIFHPLAPQRIAQTLPEVKLIVLLRNPIDRAYSHYQMNIRNGLEALSFEEATAKEEDRLRGEREKIVAAEAYQSFNHRKYSYLSRGIYVDQLKIWLNLFPREQFLILKSEDFYANSSATLEQVFSFLSLPNREVKTSKKYNVASYPDINADTRKHLIEFFEPHNQRVYKYLGTNFGWDK